MILVALWRRGLLARTDRAKLRYFLGLEPDRLTLSRRYPLWRVLHPFRLLLSPRYSRAVAAWLEYRLNLFEGTEG